MSTLTVEVVEYSLEKHPNADTLSIAHIAGWQCIVKTESFPQQKGLAVYVPIDAIADADHPLLHFLEGKKVKTIKLRQVYSQGVLLSLEEVKKYLLDTKKINEHFHFLPGVDLRELLEIRKWEPAKSTDSRLKIGRAKRQNENEKFHKYVDIEHYRKFIDHLKIGEPVCITEKLHGTSARFGLIDGQNYIGSRNVSLFKEPRFFCDVEWIERLLNSIPVSFGQVLVSLFGFTGKLKRCVSRKKVFQFASYNKPEENVWLSVFKTHDLEAILKKIQEVTNSTDVILYGEIVGEGIQDLHYGHKEATFYAYDIKVDGQYLSPQAFFDVCIACGIVTVPVLKIGEFLEADLELRTGKDFSGSHLREGIVIEPLTPRHDPFLGRVILKVISEDYLVRKGALDYENP